MGDRRSSITRPIPVGPTVQRVGQGPDLSLHGRVAVEIGTDRQGAREQKRRVDRGQLTLPDTTPRFDVQEMVEEALVTRGVRFGPLRAFDQVTESFSGDLGREVAEEDAAFDDNWNRRQCHTDGGDAGGSIRIGLVTYQPIVRVGLAQIVQDRGELQQAEVTVGQRASEIGIRSGHVSHESVGPFPNCTWTLRSPVVDGRSGCPTSRDSARS